MKSIKEIQDKYIIFALVVLQLLVTLPFINSFPIDLDEPFSIFYAQQDLSDMMSVFTEENNPPLHFILLHFWIKLFGISPIAVRSLSLLFSVLTIPVLYNFAKKIIKKEFAILTVGLFIFSTYLHYHALEARTYTLFTLLSLMVFNECYNFIFTKKGNYFKLGLLNALLLYNHYLSGYIVFVEILIMFIFHRNFLKKSFYGIVKSFIITLILYLPGAYLFIIRLKHFSSNGTWVSKPDWTDLYYTFVKLFNSELVFYIYVLLILILFFISKQSLKSILKKIDSKKLYVLLIFVFNFFGLFLFSIIFQPVFLLRYLIFIFPFVYILICILVELVYPDHLNKKYLFILIIPFVFSLIYKPNINREGDKLASYIKSKVKDKTGYDIYICPPWYELTFIYHYNLDKFSEYKTLNDYKKQSHIKPIYNAREMRLDNKKNIVFIDCDSYFVLKDNHILDSLKSVLHLEDSSMFKGNYNVYLFNKNDKEN